MKHRKPRKEINAPIQKVLMDFLKTKGVSQREFAERVDVSETTLGPWRRMTSAMKTDMMDKVLLAFPEAKQAIIEYLRGNTEENVTPVHNQAAVTKNDFERMAEIEQDIDELKKKAENLEERLEILENKKPVKTG